jgi:hypothetical protein
MKLKLIESEIPSRVSFMGKKLSFYSKDVYYRTKISNPQHIIVVDGEDNILYSSSEVLTPNSIISNDDISSIVEFYNTSGNLPDFYLFEQDI